MRVVRFRVEGIDRIGVIEEENVRAVSGSLETFWQLTDDVFPLVDVRLLAPCVPKQIICVGSNYKKHSKEITFEYAQEPILFGKAAHTIIGMGDTIIYPPQTNKLVYEAELGIVIKRKMHNITPEQASQYILGYTCANDVTARDLQLQDKQWLRCKSFDTFCPLGPWLETSLDPQDLSIKSYLNGELKQEARTSEMVYTPYELLSYISQNMTLDAGDLILTGTPHGDGEMQPGDTVAIEIEGIGRLENVVSD